MRIRSGDTVLVIAGKDKGKTGRVDRQHTKENINLNGPKKLLTTLSHKDSGESAPRPAEPGAKANVAPFLAKGDKQSRRIPMLQLSPFLVEGDRIRHRIPTPRGCAVPRELSCPGASIPSLARRSTL